jgi:hypothetical protein
LLYNTIHSESLKVLYDKDLTVCGEMNGKIKTKTQSGQQEKTRPLENSAQNKLTADKLFIGGRVDA